jgi:LacI family transcriptional regulator
MSRNRRVSIMVGLDWPLGHHHQIFAGIQRYAQECGRWECLINPYADLLLADPQKKSGIDGVIARATPRLAELAKAANIPVVNVWQNSTAQNVSNVFSDNTESGRMAAEHLLARGLRSFAFLGHDGMSSNQAQLQGFNEVLAKKGQSCSPCLVEVAYDTTPESWQRFQSKLNQWMDNWTLPIGVLTHTDFMCRYLAEACRYRHLKIPNAVTLIGSGNEVLIDTATHPTLSSIDFGYERVGHRAAQLLDELMDGAPAPTDPSFFSQLLSSSGNRVMPLWLTIPSLVKRYASLPIPCILASMSTKLRLTLQQLDEHFHDALIEHSVKLFMTPSRNCDSNK